MLTLHSGQQDALNSYLEHRFTVLTCGRRWGKTTFGVLLAQSNILKGYRVGWIAPNYKLLLEAYYDLKRLLPESKGNDMEKRISLGNGVGEFWTLAGKYGKDPARGRAYDLLIVDESAMIPNLMEVWNLALRATLTDYEGRAIFMSTPRGYNDFYSLFKMEEKDTDWKSIVAPTSSNPHIPRGEIESARKLLPEWIFKQEYLAEFIEVTDQQIFRGIKTTEGESPVKGGIYIMGVDWGRMNDATSVSVLRTDTTPVKEVFLDRMTNIPYELQYERIRTLYNKYNPRLVVSETNGLGDPNTERLIRDGIRVKRFNTNQVSKSSAIESLAIGIESGNILVFNSPIHINELRSYRSARSPGGGIKYSAPPGEHDDTVMSLALSYTGVVSMNDSALINRITRSI